MNGDDDDFLYGDDGKAPEQDTSEVPEVATADDGVLVNEGDDDDSESDVEFIIGSLESKPAQATETEEKEEATETKNEGAVAQSTGNSQTVAVLNESKFDVNQVGKYKDVPVTELTLEELKDKPWRLPGADVSDYFNFGFDELSWLAYCKKQGTLREDFNPAKVIAELMGNAASMPMPNMPPMGNGQGFMMPPMGGFMPNMQGNSLPKMPGGRSGSNPPENRTQKNYQSSTDSRASGRYQSSKGYRSRRTR